MTLFRATTVPASPSPPVSPKPPRIAVLGKGLHSPEWLVDVVQGFRESGAGAMAVNMQASSSDERRVKRNDGVRQLQNRAVLKRVGNQLGDYDPDLVVVLHKAALPAPVMDGLRACLRPAVPVIGWIDQPIPEGIDAGNATFDGVCFPARAWRPSLERLYRGRPDACLTPLSPAINPDRFPEGPATGGRQATFLVTGRISEPARRLVRDFRTQGGRLDHFGPAAGHRLRFWRNRMPERIQLHRLYRHHLACVLTANPDMRVDVRALEILCLGGLCLHPVTDELPCCFASHELPTYQSADDLVSWQRRLVADPGLLAAMKHAGRRRVLVSHTFRQRARELLRLWLSSTTTPFAGKADPAE